MFLFRSRRLTTVAPMPDRSALTPATYDDLLHALTYALQFNERGKPHRMARDAMARIAAETIARHLEMSGFVVMKRPPAPPMPALTDPRPPGAET